MTTSRRHRSGVRKAFSTGYFSLAFASLTLPPILRLDFSTSSLFPMEHKQSDSNSKQIFPTPGIQVHTSTATIKMIHQVPRNCSVLSFLPQLLAAGFHWATWSFILMLVFSQFLSIMQDTTTAHIHIYFGRDPFKGPMQIVGFNDVPFDDRVIACVKSDERYEAWQINALMATNTTILIGSTTTVKTGYRVVRRQDTTPLELDSLAKEGYESSCSLIADTMDNILDACVKLGYTSVTRDLLRFVPDYDSTEVHEIPNSLPILIMPYWDNAIPARHATPTWDGDACIYRLDVAYLDPQQSGARFRGVNQTVRQSRTIEWLRLKDTGEWRNGWYEDPTGVRWFTDVVSSWDDPRYHMEHRQFDMHTGDESDCIHTDACRSTTPFVSTWGPKTSQTEYSILVNSVYAANASRYGVFVYEADLVRVVQCLYGWETLLSNASISFLLARWMFAMVALHRGFYLGRNKWHSSGIGCIGSSKSFRLLPLVVLPRLKSSLEAFWTVGCQFEGQQVAMSESWFAVYPAIVEIMLVYYSILNTLGMVLRRRVSDALFAPSIILLCVMHYCRYYLAQSGLLSGVDGRVATVVFSDEVSRLKLVDFFSSDLPLRLNGNVHELFYAKVVILGVNLLPLIFTRTLLISKSTCGDMNGVEKALALRGQQFGGLTNTWDVSIATAVCGPFKLQKAVVPLIANNAIASSIRYNSKLGDKKAFLNGYQLLRMGYIVFGDKFLISFDDWDIITLLSPLRDVHHLWNYRVMVWTLRDSTTFHGKEVESEYPELWRVDDHRLMEVSWWKLAACDIQC